MNGSHWDELEQLGLDQAADEAGWPPAGPATTFAVIALLVILTPMVLLVAVWVLTLVLGMGLFLLQHLMGWR